MDSFKYHLQAKTPLLAIQTCEESRLGNDLIADCQAAGYRFFQWTPEALLELKQTVEPVAQIPELPLAIRAFAGNDIVSGKACLLLPDVHLMELRQYDIVRALKDFAVAGKNHEKCIVIIGVNVKLPPELEKEFCSLNYSLPTERERRVVLESMAASTGTELNGLTERLLRASAGGTVGEVEQWLAVSWAERHELSPEVVQREKCAAIARGGLLEIIHNPGTLEDIGGMAEVKTWLLKRVRCFSPEAKAYRLPTPKGFMVTGINGTGKSLLAKATASALGVPLVRIDCGKLYSSHVGSSEQNVRNMIDTLEALGACVAWFDEFEKGMSGSRSSGSTDGGTSARVFGTLLTWMAEKTSPVFIVATANDISQLPPEMLRKVRRDELYFVDLPELEERQEIWRIQIRKHHRNPEAYDLEQLAEATEKFTGAEIEALFTEALFTAFGEQREPNALDLEQAIKQTVPLSKTMATGIEALRTWSVGRARRAAPAKPNLLPVSGRKLS